jgi:carbon monoxide dehydrogenase subunit G
MELTNEFRVDATPATTWSVLTDLERIAPCMPGAQLQEVAGEDYRGVVKVKVGPMTAQYKGTASFLERDEQARRAVLKADGREARGQGSASATITATLMPDGDGTRVSLLTDLRITGKVAQFGRGVIADVSADLIGRFVESLESTVLRGAEGGAGAPEAAGPGAAPAGVDRPAPAQPVVRAVDSPEPEPVDLLDAAGAPVARRAAPLLALLAAVWLLRVLLRRRAD